jgi:hypothetical protein
MEKKNPKKKLNFKKNEDDEEEVTHIVTNEVLIDTNNDNNNQIESMKKEEDQIKFVEDDPKQETINLANDSTDYSIALTIHNMFKEKYTSVSLN